MIKDIGALLNKAKAEIRAQTDIAVIGLSGGADSTLVAVLCTLALGRENVYGIHMPYGDSDYAKFNLNSKKLSDHIGIKDLTIPISYLVDDLANKFETKSRKLSTINRGNMRSRMRMVTLYTFNYDLAEETGKRCRVIGTGNLSEDYIGFDTKGGDALADFFPIGSLFKSEVYQLLDYFVSIGMLTEKLIDRVPSAGLWDGQTDEGELGYSYNEMEPSIKRCTTGAGAIDINNPIDQFVLKRHLANKHKHVGPLVIDLSEFRHNDIT